MHNYYDDSWDIQKVESLATKKTAEVNILFIVTTKDVDSKLDDTGVELDTPRMETLYRYVKEDLGARVPEIVFDAVCDFVYYEDK